LTIAGVAWPRAISGRERLPQLRGNVTAKVWRERWGWAVEDTSALAEAAQHGEQGRLGAGMPIGRKKKGRVDVVFIYVGVQITPDALA
jgi:hypothetical protein